MKPIIDKQTESLIEQKLLQRFVEHKDEEIQTALYEVANELRAAGRDDITDQIVYQTYVQVMSF